MYSKDKKIIHLMLELIGKIQNYSEVFNNAEQFNADTKSFDAVMMNFIALGELTSKISNEFKDINNHIEWRMIYDFRNLLAHDYFGIDEEEVWDIIQNDLPELKTQLKNIH